MVIKSFQMPIGNGHWESNFFNGYFSPIVVETKFPFLQTILQTIFMCTKHECVEKGIFVSPLSTIAYHQHAGPRHVVMMIMCSRAALWGWLYSLDWIMCLASPVLPESDQETYPILYALQSIVCLTPVWQSLFCDKTFEFAIQTWQTC